MSENREIIIENRVVVGGIIVGLGGAIIAVILLSSGIRRAPWDFAGSEPMHLIVICPIYLGLGAVIGIISTFLADKMLARFLRSKLPLGIALLIGFLASAIIIFLFGLVGWAPPRA